ncbi:MAG: hypothetical protein LLG00_15405, partial [Planctomycetaceae bacterium]|nr:hypothetical protein [Planctomycetaceae bacterium]
GLNESQAMVAAGLAGTLSTALMGAKLPLEKLGGQKGLNEGIAQAVKNYALHAGEAGAVVGATSGGEALIQELSKWAADKGGPDFGRVVTDTLQGGAQGTVMGGIIGAPHLAGRMLAALPRSGNVSRADARKAGVPEEVVRQGQTARNAYRDQFVAKMREQSKPIETPTTTGEPHAQFDTQAGQDNGGRGPQPPVREESWNPAESGEGVQPGGLEGQRREPVEGQRIPQQTAGEEKALGEPADRSADAVEAMPAENAKPLLAQPEQPQAASLEQAAGGQAKLLGPQWAKEPPVTIMEGAAKEHAIRTSTLQFRRKAIDSGEQVVVGTQDGRVMAVDANKVQRIESPTAAEPLATQPSVTPALAPTIPAKKSLLKPKGWDKDLATRAASGEPIEKPEGITDERWKAMQTQAAKQAAEQPDQGKRPLLKEPHGTHPDIPSLLVEMDERPKGVGDKPRWVEYQTVGPEEGARLKATTGLELSGYRHTVDEDGILHAMKGHGVDSPERPKDEPPLTPSDIAAIPEIIAHPDNVELSAKVKNDLTPKRIVYKKRGKDGVVVVEEVRTGRRRLALKTMYKIRPGTKERPDLAWSRTSETTEPQGSALAAEGQDATKIIGSADAKVKEESGAAPPPPPLPPAVPAEVAKGRTSIKNRIVDEERAARGATPLTSEGGGSLDRWNTEAKARMEADPTWVPGLLDDLRDSKRAPDPVEHAALTRHKLPVKKAFEEAAAKQAAAYDAGDLGTAEAMQPEVTRLSDELNNLDQVTRRTGTAASYSLMSRKLELEEDGSVAALSLRRRAAKGGVPLSSKEQAEVATQAAELKASNEKLATLLKDREEQLATEREKAAQAEIDRQIEEHHKGISEKRRTTIEGRFERQYAVAHDYGVDPQTLREAATERADAEAKEARDYNQAYKAVVKATGLTPAVIRDIERGGFFEGGKPVDINEYKGLDTKAPMLAREYPELGLQAENADALQGKDYAQDLVDLIKRGPRAVPEWYEKLDEVAREMAAGKGKELPEEFHFPWEREPGEDFETLPESATESMRPKSSPAPTSAETPAKKPIVRPRAKRGAWYESAKKKADASLANFMDKWATFGGLHVAGDPRPAEVRRSELLEAAVAVVRDRIELGAATFAEFMASLGDKAKDARETFRAAWDSLRDKGEVPSPVRDATDLAEIGRLAKKLTRWTVESGVTDRELVVDEVHAELKGVLPEITRRQTMDAMSGYGEFKELPKDAISLKVRAIKGELQQLSKLEDMAKGKAPTKTGIERRQPSDEERRLIAQVNEAKKKGGFTVTDPGKQLKTALDAAKTALKHRIADLEQEISTRTKIVKERTPLTPDAELAALKKHRDELRAIHDEIFPAKRSLRKITDAQRLKLLDKALDRSISQLEQDLDAGRLGPKPKATSLTSPEIEAKRAKLDALRAQRDELRANSPEYQASVEARQTAAYKRALTKRYADLQERWAAAKRGELPVKKKLLKTKVDNEITAAKYRIEQLWRSIRAAEDKTRRAQRPTWKKALGVVPETVRTIRSVWTSFDFSAVGRQGGWLAFSHPVAAARAQLRSFRAFASDKTAFEIAEEIASRPNAQSGLYARAGLELTDISGPLAGKEEAYQSSLAERIPGVKASERAYVSQLNQQRADVFDAMVAQLSLTGTPTLPEAKIIANYINVASGRGDVGGYRQAATALAVPFFAPRLYLSRFQLLLGQPFLKDAGAGSWRVRRLLAKEYAKSLGGIGLFLATSYAALYGMMGPPSDDDARGWSITLNPYSPDCGKIRLGATRIDPLAGLSQTARLTTRLTTNMVNGVRSAFGGNVSASSRKEMENTGA